MVPLIDLNCGHSRLLEQLDQACMDWGVFQLRNHGIEPRLTSALQGASRAFFDQSLPAKQCVSRSEHNAFGFYDRELTKNLRDRKEIFDFAPLESTPWPDSPLGFRESLQDHALACHELAQRILALCCENLSMPGISLGHHFEPRHSSFLRLNHYPVDDPVADQDAPSAGPRGISQHTDAGALTIRLQDDVSGLQVLHGGDWLDVPPAVGCLTVNIGDMLQVWSNDRYQAPLHRVRASEQVERFSAAYFFNPDYDCVVQPLPALISPDRPARYRPVHWGEFRQQRALGDYADYGEEVQVSNYRI